MFQKESLKYAIIDIAMNLGLSKTCMKCKSNCTVQNSQSIDKTIW